MDKRLKHLNALHTFECAARHKSYSKAAEELFVSQAAVSQQIRLLESHLAIKLFARNGRQMELTASGETLHQSCQKGFDEIIKGLNSIQCEGIAGDLTITSTQAFCSLWLMPRLYKFSLQHPEINIKILGSNQIEDLQKKHIDLAIRFSTKMNAFDDNQLIVQDFGDDYAYPVCSPKLIEKYHIKSPADLLKCRLVSLANEKIVTWRDWFTHVGVQGFDTHISKTEVTSSDMALSAVLTGDSVALAVSALFLPYIKSKQLIVPFNIRHPSHWKRYIAYSTNSSKHARIKVFVQWLQQEMQESSHQLSLIN